MEPWQQLNRRACRDLATLAQHLSLDTAPLAAVVERYPLRLSAPLLEQLATAGNPLTAQFVPQEAELDAAGQPDDPLAEESLAAVPQLVHRYANRALLLVADSCFAYCRFCTRKRRVGRTRGISFGEIERALDHIAATPAIREVILSGGDPLVMSDALLGQILQRLAAMPQVRLVRIGSRAPLTLPERITPRLCNLLARHNERQPLYLLTHFNHPAELTAGPRQACADLRAAGLSLLNQTVLLRGINDEVATLAELCYQLTCWHVRPYYLHQMDLTAGTAHFRTSLARGIALIEALRRELPGLALPRFVVDLPGGLGKMPLEPDALVSPGPAALLRSPTGALVPYPDLVD